MNNYTRFSNFNKRNSFNKLRFGSNTPLTEIELNELQEIQEHQRREISIKTNGDIFNGSMVLFEGEFTLNPSTLIVNGEYLETSKLKIAVNNNDKVYLRVYNKDVSYLSEIKSMGNLQSDILETNTMLDDTMSGIETARRIQTVYDLYVGTVFDEDKYYLPLGEIINNKLVKLTNKKFTHTEICEEGSTSDNPNGLSFIPTSEYPRITVNPNIAFKIMK